MKNNLTVLFDLDGTLLDTSKGIINSYKYTINKLNLLNKKTVELKKFIGRNLNEVFINEFSLNSNESTKALNIFRNYYKHQGIYEYTIYRGIKKTLKQLKESNFELGVVTLKMQQFAEAILKDAGIFNFFNFVRGVTNGIEETKSSLISNIKLKSNNKFVLIGDSKNDYESALFNNIKFIGVLYGFGFNKNNMVSKITFCDTPCKIAKTVSEFESL